MELPYGFVRVSFMGSETVTKITFGPSDAESILGVVALESTGIGVDPVTRTLKRMAAKPLNKVWRTRRHVSIPERHVSLVGEAERRGAVVRVAPSWRRRSDVEAQ